MSGQTHAMGSQHARSAKPSSAQFAQRFTRRDRGRGQRTTSEVTIGRSPPADISRHPTRTDQMLGPSGTRPQRTDQSVQLAGFTVNLAFDRFIAGLPLGLAFNTMAVAGPCGAAMRRSPLVHGVETARCTRHRGASRQPRPPPAHMTEAENRCDSPAHPRRPHHRSCHQRSSAAMPAASTNSPPAAPSMGVICAAVFKARSTSRSVNRGSGRDSCAPGAISSPP